MGVRVFAEIGRAGRFAGEASLVRRDGQQFWALLQARPLPEDKEGRQVVVSVTDLTQQKRLQDY
ncbi:MAG: PAS domain-containing protein, partial [Candidatus Nanopelagicales bacterium]